MDMFSGRLPTLICCATGWWAQRTDPADSERAPVHRGNHRHLQLWV